MNHRPTTKFPRVLRRAAFVSPLIVLMLVTLTRAAPAAPFDLGALNGPNGFRLTGDAPGDRAGGALANAGDVNGDGLDDVVIGAASAAADGMQGAGATYVVFGAANNPTSLTLANLNGSNGFRLTGALFNDAAGTAVAGGDVNGDGLADLLIGAPGASPHDVAGAGAVYVVFGASSFPARLSLDTLDGSRGFRIDGTLEEGGAGAGLGYAGDVNGDGLGDIVIGAPNVAEGAREAAGRAYVVFGRRAFPPRLSLAGLGGSNGLTLPGVSAESYAGHRAGAAGDLNGDGYDDAFIAAHGASRPGAAGSGAVYVLFGRAVFPAGLDLGDLVGANGFRIDGAAAGDGAGWAAAGGGDVNGDGRDDLLIGAPDAAARAGHAYVVLGAASFPNALNLGALNGGNGFRLAAGDDPIAVGAAVAAADLNGDGRDDVVVGASLAGEDSQRFAGRVYAVFGRPSFAAAVDLAALDAATGLRFDGAAAGDQAGYTLAAAGDRNGDGFDELLIGAPSSGVAAQRQTGAGFLVQGGPTLGVPMPLTHPGTPDDNALTGTANADVLHGHRGDDTLDAAAGDDALLGGQGDDALLGGAGADALIGGNGTDAASFAASPAGVTVNLFTGAAAGGHAAGDRLRSVEDLIGSPHADTLTGDALDNTLAGGAGDDALTGGRGDDAFAFGPGGGDNTLFDFVPGAGSLDRLDFTGWPAVGGVADLTIRADGGDTLITLPDEATIRLKGVAPAALHGDDYRFAGAPLARADQYTTQANTPLTVRAPGVLGNDDNPSAAPLSAVLVAGPAHGAVELRPNGSFTYTPAAGFLGSDQFTYRANNGQNSNVVPVTIVVSPRPPTANDDSYTAALGETLTVAAPGVLGNDDNPGGAPLTATLVDEPVNGTLALAADGSFRYTPSVEMAILDSFSYRADNGLASNVATVTIAVVDPDGPPVAVDDHYTARAGEPLTVAAPGVLGNDVNPLPGGMTAVLGNGPAHGQLTLNANGSFSYTADAAFQGQDTFTYRADNGQRSAPATVTITVSDDDSGFRVFLPMSVAD